MSNLTIHLVYEKPGVKPQSIARVNDGPLLSALAKLVISRARVRASKWIGVDEAILFLENDHVNKLAQFLAMTVPGLQIEENKGVH